MRHGVVSFHAKIQLVCLVPSVKLEIVEELKRHKSSVSTCDFNCARS